MGRQSIGLADKLYWRWAGGVAHCFKKTRFGRPVVLRSLCGRYDMTRSGGQSCNRPPAAMRCAMCDSREIGRRGKESSLPESPGWCAT
jgi:hypothetical protein